MDTQEKISNLIKKWVGDAPLLNYDYNEFLAELEKMKKKEEDLIKVSNQYGVTSEGRIHRYTLDCILEPLIGKMKYGRRD